MGIQYCHSFNDFRQLAKKRLPAPLFHYIDGGAEDEWTLKRNTEAFEQVALVPNALADLTGLDISTTVLGRKLSMPLFCAPTGMTRLFHPEGELAVARAASQLETYYSLSTLSTVSIGRWTSHHWSKMFQLYIHKDRSLTTEFIERCKAAHFDALCLTVDTLVTGNRERDKRTGLIMPPQLTAQSLLSFALHPLWAWNYLKGEKFELANLSTRLARSEQDLVSVMSYVTEQFDRGVVWRDAEAIIAQWGKPFAIKGIMSVADAKRAVEIGASAIMLSNHGGRQLEGCAAPFDVLPKIADAVGGQIEIIVDGGIRRGTHVLKALAMGATACSMGRSYLFPLAAGGQAGVERALGLLKAEIERNMILMGCQSLKDLDRDKVMRL